MSEKRSNISQAINHWKTALTLREIGHDSEKLIKLERLNENRLNLSYYNFELRKQILLKNGKLFKLAKFNFYECLDLNELSRNKSIYDKYLINNFEKLNKLWLFVIDLQINFCKPYDNLLVENFSDFLLYLNYIIHNKLIEFRGEFQSEYSFTLRCLLDKILQLIQQELMLIITNEDRSIKKEFFKNENIVLNFENATLDGIWNCKKRLNQSDIDYLKSSIEQTFRMSVYLLRLIIKSQLKFSSKIDEKILSELKPKIKEIINYSYLFNFGQSFLSFSLHSNVLSNFIYYSRKIRTDFDPINYECVEFLLKCGVSPDTPVLLSNSKQSNKNTCFNYLLFVQNEIVNQKTILERFILLFIKYGAHFDSRNSSKLSVLDQYKMRFNTDLNDLIDSSINVPTLKCLCSKEIVNYKINYEAYLPKTLSNFVNLH